MITAKIVFALYFDENNEFQKTKRVFGSVFPSSSGDFGEIEKAHIGAISWTSVWTPLSILKKLARWHPMQKSYSRFPFNGNHAKYESYCLSHWTYWFTVANKEYDSDKIGSWDTPSNAFSFSSSAS